MKFTDMTFVTTRLLQKCVSENFDFTRYKMAVEYNFYIKTWQL